MKVGTQPSQHQEQAMNLSQQTNQEHLEMLTMNLNTATQTMILNNKRLEELPEKPFSKMPLVG